MIRRCIAWFGTGSLNLIAGSSFDFACDGSVVDLFQDYLLLNPDLFVLLRSVSLMVLFRCRARAICDLRECGMSGLCRVNLERDWFVVVVRNLRAFLFSTLSCLFSDLEG